MKQILLAVAFFISAIPVALHAEILSSAGTALTIQSIRTALNSVIDTATDRADYLAFRAGLEAKMALDQWEKVNSDLIGKTFSELDKTQQNFFINLDKTAKSLTTDISLQVQEANKIVELLNQTVADVKVWDGKPAIFSSSPSVLPPTFKDGILLKFRGINIDNANPQLFISGHPNALERTDLLRQEVRFVIPKENVKFSEDKAKRIELTLKLEKSRGFFANIFNSEPEVFDVPVSIMLLPKTLATLTLNVTEKQGYREYLKNERVREFSHSSGDLSDNCKNESQRPTDGYLIDTGSFRKVDRPHPDAGKTINLGITKIKIPKDARSPSEWGKGGSWRYKDKTQHGFVVEVCAKRIFHGPLGLDTKPGNKHVRIGWKEYIDKTRKVDVQLRKDAPINWGNDFYVDFSDASDQFVLKVKMFNGLEKTYTHSEITDFLDIDFNIATKQLLIKPLVPKALTIL